MLIVPGFLSGASKYEGMADELRRMNAFDAVEIVPIETADWYPTLAGADFRRILDKIEAAAQRALASSSSPGKKLLVVGHSAGGWLARCWMGSRPYSGGVVYAGGSRVDTLLTLGTPHYSLEAYPFGRIPESRNGERLEEDTSSSTSDYQSSTWNMERARGSTLALTNWRYPGTHQSGVRYVAVCGRSVKGAALGSWPIDLAAVGAGVSYAASCGEAEVEGDGVTPVETAMLEGAERVVLDGVTHQPPPGKPKKKESHKAIRWYGDVDVVRQWAPLLLRPRAEEA